MLRAPLLLLPVIAMCGGPRYRVEQASLVPLPTAPVSAPTSGGIGVDLSTATPTVVEPGDGANGIAVPASEPGGSLFVRVTDAIGVRAFLSMAPGPGRRQASGAIEAPGTAAGAGGLGASFRLLLDESRFSVDLAPSVGLAVATSEIHAALVDCSGASCPTARDVRSEIVDVVPFFAIGLRFGARPVDWLDLRLGVTVRNQPDNLRTFTDGSSSASSVSTGPIGMILHADVQVDFTDEAGVVASVQWPAVGLGMRYGPLVVVGVQGRIDGSNASPFGVRE